MHRRSSRSETTEGRIRIATGHQAILPYRTASSKADSMEVESGDDYTGRACPELEG